MTSTYSLAKILECCSQHELAHLRPHAYTHTAETRSQKIYCCGYSQYGRFSEHGIDENCAQNELAQLQARVSLPEAAVPRARQARPSRIREEAL